MAERSVLMGVVGRPHGVRGLLRVVSYTADARDLAAYGPLSDGTGRRFALQWRGEGVAELSEVLRDGAAVPVTDRSTAEKLTNTRLYLERDRLPQTEADEFYLADLIGLQAIDAAGAPVGRVAAVHDYGAGTSLEIVRPAAPPLLLPFTRAAVPDVDIGAGRLTVVPPIEMPAREDAEPAV